MIHLKWFIPSIDTRDELVDMKSIRLEYGQ